MRTAVGRVLRWGLLAASLVATAAGAIACGEAAPPANTANGFQAYAECLSRNGVTLPSGLPGGRPPGSFDPSRFPSGGPGGGPGGPGGPGGGPGGPGGGGGPGGPGGGLFGDQAPEGVDQATWDKAQQACASVRPTGGPGGVAGNSAARAYLNCLSDHGVTTTGRPDQLNTTDPKVADAMKACEALRPTGPPRPTPTASS